MSENFQQIVLREFTRFFEPLLLAGQSPSFRRRLFGEIGWDLDAITDLPVSKIHNALNQLITPYQMLQFLVAQPPQTLEELRAALKAVDDARKAVQGFASILDDIDDPELELPSFELLGSDLIGLLSDRYLRNYHATGYAVAVLLTLIQPRTLDKLPDAVRDTKSNQLVRFPNAPPILALDRVGELLTHPARVLREEYLGVSGLANPTEAKAVALRLFPPLAALLEELGGGGFAVDPAEITAKEWGTVGAELANATITAFVPFEPGEDLEGSGVGATLTLSADLGLVVSPFGTLTFSRAFDSWVVDAKFTGDVGAFALGKQGLVVVGSTPGAEPERVQGEISLRKVADAGGPAFLVGSTTGSRMEIGQFAVTGDISLDQQEQDYGFLIEAGQAVLVVSPGDGDGFLQKVLPQEGFHTDFDLALGWSKRKGLYFRGSVGLEATLPVHKSLLGVITLDSVYLAIETQASDETQDSKILLALAVTGMIKLGPVSTTVERMGLEGKLTFPPDGGNLGPANLDRLGFKPPSGVGLAIDAGAVFGGGYLFFAPAKEQYAGVMELEFRSISLKAIGLLTTRMPDGSSGFSLLVIITAEFPPIQLGFGFTLNGAGGLLGVNRTVVAETLRAGIKNRTLDSILFPKDPLLNASQLISTLGAVFPPAPDRYVFGPMAILAWGNPPILRVEIGLVLELPSPVRLIIMGKLKLALPGEEATVVLLQMDALGIIDFGKGDASVDATLYDSRIGPFCVTGDMTMRANWAASPSFALSAGGLNPRFQRPLNFPELDRMAIALARGDSPRVRLEAYLAITSNTAQVGARLDLYAAVGKFSLQAYLGFDALFQFSPFRFIVDLFAVVALQRNGKSLLTVELRTTLSGPKPLHAWGTATFEFLKISQQISFDLKIGDDPPPESLPTADPLPDLIKALKNPGNWSAQLPAEENTLVSLREVDAPGDILAHPLGDFTVRQRVVPLNVNLAKYGNATLSGASRFWISVTLPGSTLAPQPAPQPVKDYFAPAQFFAMSDIEKLSRPSFEQLESGIRFGTSGTVAGPKVEADLDYESVVIDIEDKTTQELPVYTMAQEAALALARAGAAGTSPMTSTGSAKYRGADFGIKVRDTSYAVASTEDLSGLDGVAKGLSYTEALEKQLEYATDHPDEADLAQVVTDYEVAQL